MKPLYLVVGLLTVATCLGACTQHSTKVEALRSPLGNYTVSLRGSRTKPSLPLVYATLVGSTSSRQGVLCSDLELYMADFFDSAFAVEYPTSSWPRENVLRFKAELDRSGSATDRLEIRNETDQVVPCLKINLFDLLLVMDVKPGEVMELDISRQPGGGVFFAAETKGMDAAVVKANTGFDRSDYPMNTPLTCTVTISKGRLSLGIATSAARAGN